MAQGSQNASFIPKQSLAKETPRGKRPLNAFGSIAIGILFLALLAYGGLYYYTDRLQQDINQKSAQLREARSAIDNTTIDRAKALEARINATETLIDRHTALTAVFNTLESGVVAEVQFTDMEVVRGAQQEDVGAGDGSANAEDDLHISLSGISPGFTRITALRNTLRETDLFDNIVVSNLEVRREEGEVEFTVETSLTPSQVAYEQVHGGTSSPSNENEEEGDATQEATSFLETEADTSSDISVDDAS